SSTAAPRGSDTPRSNRITPCTTREVLQAHVGAGQKAPTVGRMDAIPTADLVCEGGGIRGIGLVGAVHTLAAAGYQFPRVAGSSAGAVVAALIAALQVAGEPLSRLDDLAA